MKVYILVKMDNDGACGDPECCGEPSYWPTIHEKAFTDKALAFDHLTKMNKGRGGWRESDWEIREVTL